MALHNSDPATSYPVHRRYLRLAALNMAANNAAMPPCRVVMGIPAESLDLRRLK
jgi:hypothetical protein